MAPGGLVDPSVQLMVSRVLSVSHVYFLPLQRTHRKKKKNCWGKGRFLIKVIDHSIMSRQRWNSNFSESINEKGHDQSCWIL